MSIHVALQHVTHYRYDRRVTMSPQVIRLRPAPHARTPIDAYSLKVTPRKVSGLNRSVMSANPGVLVRRRAGCAQAGFP